jgi:hypothetical protein
MQTHRSFEYFYYYSSTGLQRRCKSTKCIKLSFHKISLAQKWNSIVKIAQRSGTFELTYGTTINTMAKGQSPRIK